LSRFTDTLDRPSQPPVTIPGAWPLLGHAGSLLHDPLGFLERAYRLGDVVVLRLGPKPAYLVNASEPFRWVLVGGAPQFDKGFQIDKLRALIGDGIGTSTGSKHRRQRRLMRPAFDHSHVEGYVGIMAQCATQAADEWRGGRTFDAGREMRLLAMTTIIRTVLGAGDVGGIQTDLETQREVIASLSVLLAGVGRRAILPLKLLDNTPTPGNLRFNRAHDTLHALVNRMVADHRAAHHARNGNGHGNGGLLDTLLAAVDEDDGTGMSDQQLHDEVMTVLLAGSETSAGTLGWLLHILSQDPDLQRAIQQELDTVLQGRTPRAGDLGSLPLMRRVVTETLRMYPASWLLGRRTLEPIEIAGVPVPKRAQVLLNFYGLHRDPQAYPNPDRFDPDRWINPDPEVMRSYYSPFGMGPNICIGEGFAWSLIMTTLAIIASQYTVKPVPGSVIRPVARTTLHPGVVPLTLEPR
jgi:cytochrome P450